VTAFFLLAYASAKEQIGALKMPAAAAPSSMINPIPSFVVGSRAFQPLLPPFAAFALMELWDQVSMNYTSKLVS
jgi:hypothetical protein